MVETARSDNVGDSVRNIFWAYASFFSTKVLNLISIVVLAWYLDPEEFGLMAICLAILGYFEIISQFGMGMALISAREKVEEVATAVFICGLALSGAIFVLIWFTAPAISDWYGDPKLAELLPVIAVALIVNAAATVNVSFLYRELRLKAKVIPDVARGLTKGLVAILLAILGFGVWALVLGYLLGAIAGGIVTYIVRPWRPTRRPDRETYKYIVHFGSNLIGAQTINATPLLLDNLLVGKVLGMTALGIYSLAFRIPELGIKTFTNVAASVLHPIMSKIQSDPAELKAYYYGALKYCSVLMFGMGGAIAVLAEPLVHVLYAPKWYGMIVPMQLLAIAFAIGTIEMVPGNVFKAVSRTDLTFKVSVINLPFFVVLIWLAVPYGITAVAFVQLVLAVIRFVPNYLMLKRIMDVSARKTLHSLTPGIVCALIGSAAGLAVQGLEVVDGDVVKLLAATTAYSASFCLAARVVMPEVFREIRHRMAGKPDRV